MRDGEENVVENSEDSFCDKLLAASILFLYACYCILSLLSIT